MRSGQGAASPAATLPPAPLVLHPPRVPLLEPVSAAPTASTPYAPAAPAPAPAPAPAALFGGEASDGGASSIGARAFVMPDMTGTFPCGSVRLPARLGGKDIRVPLRVHFLLVFVPAFSIAGVILNDGGVGSFLLVSMLAGPGLFAAVLAHEMGHLIASVRCGGEPQFILLWPLGGLAVSAGCGRTHAQQIFISAMGPATHVPMAVVWFFLFLAAYPPVGEDDDTAKFLDVGQLSAERGSDWFALWFFFEFIDNVVMFAFNAFVPCFPLDCSNIAMNVAAARGYSEPQIAYVPRVSSGVRACVFPRRPAYS